MKKGMGKTALKWRLTRRCVGSHPPPSIVVDKTERLLVCGA
jgi:hypothetical protein